MSITVPQTLYPGDGGTAPIGELYGPGYRTTGEALLSLDFRELLLALRQGAGINLSDWMARGHLAPPTEAHYGRAGALLDAWLDDDPHPQALLRSTLLLSRRGAEVANSLDVRGWEPMERLLQQVRRHLGDGTLLVRLLCQEPFAHIVESCDHLLPLLRQQGWNWLSGSWALKRRLGGGLALVGIDETGREKRDARLLLAAAQPLLAAGAARTNVTLEVDGDFYLDPLRELRRNLPEALRRGGLGSNALAAERELAAIDREALDAPEQALLAGARYARLVPFLSDPACGPRKVR